MLLSRSVLSPLAMASAAPSCSVLIDTKDPRGLLDAGCADRADAFAASVCAGSVCVAPGCSASSARLNALYNRRAMSSNAVLSEKGWFSYAEVLP